ncbi:MAG: hypothetical protein GY820_20855 [Gammaproteobacteria bacterium]|nr:hypothetical protein [Gammaproteobacteria bacterium]
MNKNHGAIWKGATENVIRFHHSSRIGAEHGAILVVVTDAARSVPLICVKILSFM